MDIHEDERSKYTKIGRVEIFQYLNYDKNPHWQPATINGPATGTMEWREALAYANDIKEAAMLAKHWTEERAGKPAGGEG